MDKLEFTIGDEVFLWSSIREDSFNCYKDQELEKKWKGRTFISTDRTNIIHYLDFGMGWVDIAGSGDNEEYNELFFNLPKKEVWITVGSVPIGSIRVGVKGEHMITEELYLKLKEAYDLLHKPGDI